MLFAKDAVKPGMPSERVTFSFDSAGWLYVYQLLACISIRACTAFEACRSEPDCPLLRRFGVAAFLQVPGRRDCLRQFCADTPAAEGSVVLSFQEHLMPAPGSSPDPSHYPDGLGFSGSKLFRMSRTCLRAFGFRNSLSARSAGALTALLLASGTSVPDVFEHVLAQ